jgi:decaprenyl-phosphate phosphoribosyltransferase
VQGEPGGLWLTVSALPFVTALLRYGLLGHQGAGGEPEDIPLCDRDLQALAVVWLACLAAGVYGT